MKLTPLHRFLASLAFLTILAVPAVAGRTRIYVSNQDGASVDVIDPDTNMVIQRIKDIGSPDGIAFSPSGDRAYVADRAEHVLNVFDTKTGVTIKKVPLSQRPNLPVISKDGKRVYVAIWPLKPDENIHGAVDVVDTSTLTLVKTIPTNGGLHDMYISGDGNYLFAGSNPGRRLIVIDLRTDEPMWEVPFDTGLLTMAIENGPDGSPRRIFIELKGLGGFAVVDFAKRKEVERIKFPIGAPGASDSTTGMQIGSAHGTSVTPDGKELWVCGEGYNTASHNTVHVYSLPELKLMTQFRLPELENQGLPLEQDPGIDEHWVSFTPDYKRAYVSMAADNSVSVIDVKTLKQVARIMVGKNPRHVTTVVLP